MMIFTRIYVLLSSIIWTNNAWVRNSFCFIRTKRCSPTREINLERFVNAVPTEENINPAFFSKNLYEVLGVSSKASRNEIKAAYMKIVSKTHPDRAGDNAESLELYRNASYAYKVLYKDQELRRLYDSNYATQQIVDVIGEVGSEVVVPLAMEVAVPLINLTMKSISSFAFPFIRDAFEQSTVLLRAALNTEDIPEQKDKAFNYVKRAASNVAQARETVGTAQELRRLKQQYEDISKDLTRFTKQLNDSRMKETEVRLIINDKFIMSSALNEKVKDAQRAVQLCLLESNRTETDAKEASVAYRTKSIAVNALERSSDELNGNIDATKAEILRLEAALRDAKARLQDLTLHLQESTAELQNEDRLMKNFKKEFDYRASAHADRVSQLRNASKVESGLRRALEENERSLLDSQTAAEKQAEKSAVYERRLSALLSKREQLEQKYQMTQQRWKGLRQQAKLESQGRMLMSGDSGGPRTSKDGHNNTSDVWDAIDRVAVEFEALKRAEVVVGVEARAFDGIHAASAPVPSDQTLDRDSRSDEVMREQLVELGRKKQLLEQRNAALFRSSLEVSDSDVEVGPVLPTDTASLAPVTDNQSIT